MCMACTTDLFSIQSLLDLGVGVLNPHIYFFLVNILDKFVSLNLLITRDFISSDPEVLPNCPKLELLK